MYAPDLAHEEDTAHAALQAAVAEVEHLADTAAQEVEAGAKIIIDKLDPALHPIQHMLLAIHTLVAELNDRFKELV